MGDVRCRRAFVLFYFALALTSSSFIASTEGYRVSEERQRQMEEEKGRVHCSRSRSRTVRAIISEYLLPFVEAQKFNLSKTCRLHSDNDLFREQEEKVEELRPMQWHCGYCKKVFRTQSYLDMHFDNRHSDMLDTSSNKCLADLCGALHCNYYNSMSTRKPKKPCKPAVAERNLHLCEVLANTCFPVEHSPVAQRLNGFNVKSMDIWASTNYSGVTWKVRHVDKTFLLPQDPYSWETEQPELLRLKLPSVKIADIQDFFKRQFCDSHTCKKQLKIFPRGSGIYRNKSLYYAISLFTIVVLMIYYLAVYLHQKEMNTLTKGLRRATKKPSPTARKAN